MSDARHSHARVAWVSLAAVVRNLPLFVRRTPRTPLRALGIVALDILHTLRKSRPLPRSRANAIALLLDLGGCANAVWDRKACCVSEFRSLRARLEQAGLGTCTGAYLGRLRRLERHRPAARGDERNARAVHVYREEVARHSLETAAAIALGENLNDARAAAAMRDPDLDTLFRILMLCQVIDDVVDAKEDAASRLPSFATACANGADAKAGACEAVTHYADGARAGTVFPFRIVLRVLALVARVAIHMASWADATVPDSQPRLT